MRDYLTPVCDLLAYCLMPNHFNFLIHANESSVLNTKAGAPEMQMVSAGIKNLLSTYTKAYNKMYNRTGSLFVQNTPATEVSDIAREISTGYTCFNYIHQKPFTSGLVSKVEDWQFSSFRDYMGLRNGTLCDQLLAFKLLEIDKEKIYQETYKRVSKDRRDMLFERSIYNKSATP